MDHSLPTRLDVAEAYADAVLTAATADGAVALTWRAGSLCVESLHPGESRADYPVFVTAGMTNFYPWCPDVGVTCVGWDDSATRADVATLVLESGYADTLIDLLSEDAAGFDDLS